MLKKIGLALIVLFAFSPSLKADDDYFEGHRIHRIPYRVTVISGPFIKGQDVKVKFFHCVKWKNDEKTKRLTLKDGFEEIGARPSDSFLTKDLDYTDNDIVVIIIFKDNKVVFYYNETMPKKEKRR